MRLRKHPRAGGHFNELFLSRRKTMEHKPRVDLQTVADLIPVVATRAPMSREARLARWVAALERDPKRILKPLHEIEFKSGAKRRAIRVDNSPLTVAFEDPVLRAEGLTSDRLGDAMDFFQLTEHEAHTAFCSCHLGSGVEARHVARRVQYLIAPTQIARPRNGNVIGRLYSALFGR
jgi:hypothetical protein